MNTFIPGTGPAVPAAQPGPLAVVPARPEPIELPLAHTALIVVDMQHGYASPGGYRDLAGKDIGPARAVIDNCVKLVDAARKSGVTVVYFQNGWRADLADAGGPGSPNWHKSNPLKLMRERAALQGKILTEGSWDYELVKELEPRDGEFVVPKARYSGFCGTDLDGILRSRNIRHLLFCGIATNVCVESTLREAYHREYFCVLAHDAAQHSGPEFIQQASLYNVETFLGWVSDTQTICGALAGATPPAAR
jgi:ureidoacrylate peracid hydrolase